MRMVPENFANMVEFEEMDLKHENEFINELDRKEVNLRLAGHDKLL